MWWWLLLCCFVSGFIESPFLFVPDLSSPFLDKFLVFLRKHEVTEENVSTIVFPLWKQYMKQIVKENENKYGLKKIKAASIENTNRIAVLIEPREDEDLAFLVKHVMNMLNYEKVVWALQIFCLESCEQLRKEFGFNESNVLFTKLPRSMLGQRGLV